MEKSFDRNMFLDKFREETTEHIQKLNKNLLVLENDPENVEIIGELSREAHTLKGSAKMMGINEIAEISHRMEDIFGLLREKEVVLRPEIIDILFESLDAIDSLLKAILSGDKHSINVKDICKRLKEISSEEGIPPSDFKQSEEKKTVKEEEVDKKEKPFSLPPAEIAETIRVNTSKLDKLVNLMSEIVVAQIKSGRYLTKMKELWTLAGEQVNLWEKIYKTKIHLENTDSKELEMIFNEVNNRSIKIRDESFILFKEYDENFRQTALVIEGLREGLMGIRMLPLSTVFNFFPRTVRDFAKEYNKEIKLEISGEDTELDKKVLEEIKDPLIHLVRNAIDHGIEESKERLRLNKPPAGKIKLSAKQEGDRVFIYIEDDGRGIDARKFKKVALKKGFIDKNTFESISDREAMFLIFEPGFTTSPIITNISGRGIGMEVVKNKIEGLKGEVLVESESGKGTKFSLSLPLTLATTRVLLVETSNQDIYAIPTASIETITRVFLKDIIYTEGKEALKMGRRVIPLVELSDLLGLPFKSKEILPVVVISYARHRIGVVVNKLIGEEEIVIKNLGNFLKRVENIAGSTLLGSGEVVLVLNISEIMRLVSRMGKTKLFHRQETEKKKRSILIVEDSLTTRELERSIIEAAGYKVEIAVDGVEAIEKVTGTDEKFDLLVVDIQMPRMDGFQLTEWMKKNEKYKDIPVIIVTALELAEEKKRGIEVGAEAYIVKSAFDQASLLDTIERLVK